MAAAASCSSSTRAADALAVVLVEAHTVDRPRGRVVALRDLPGHDPWGYDVPLVGAVLQADDVPDLVQRDGAQRRRVLHGAHQVAHAQLDDGAAKPALGVVLARHLAGTALVQ